MNLSNCEGTQLVRNANCARSHEISVRKQGSFHGSTIYTLNLRPSSSYRNQDDSELNRTFEVDGYVP